MSISRIDKLVREVLQCDSIGVAASFRSIDVDIFVAADHTEKSAQMAMAAVSLALRTFAGDVRVHLPAGVAGLNWERRSLAELLRSEAQSFGTPHRLQINPDRVGKWRLGLGVQVEGAICADAQGWLASVNRIFPHRDESAAPAAVFATCCAFAKLFSAAALGRTKSIGESWTLDLLELRIGSALTNHPTHIHDLGKISLLGAGAIGSGFAYTLWLSGWGVSLKIIDKDYYDEPNHETTLVVGRPEVLRNRKKAIALAELIRRPGLQTTFVVEEVLDGSHVLAQPTDVFVCAVDNAPTRRILDNVKTGLLLNSGVGGQSEDAGHVLWSRHLTGEEQLSRLYANSRSTGTTTLPPIEFREDCSRVAYYEVSLAAPFIGLSAGALLAAACAARVLNSTPSSANYFKIDLLRLQSRFQRESRLRVVDRLHLPVLSADLQTANS